MAESPLANGVPVVGCPKAARCSGSAARREVRCRSAAPVDASGGRARRTRRAGRRRRERRRLRAEARGGRSRGGARGGALHCAGYALFDATGESTSLELGAVLGDGSVRNRSASPGTTGRAELAVASVDAIGLVTAVGGGTTGARAAARTRSQRAIEVDAPGGVARARRDAESFLWLRAVRRDGERHGAGRFAGRARLGRRRRSAVPLAGSRDRDGRRKRRRHCDRRGVTSVEMEVGALRATAQVEVEDRSAAVVTGVVLDALAAVRVARPAARAGAVASRQRWAGLLTVTLALSGARERRSAGYDRSARRGGLEHQRSRPPARVARGARRRSRERRTRRATGPSRCCAAPATANQRTWQRRRRSRRAVRSRAVSARATASTSSASTRAPAERSRRRSAGSTAHCRRACRCRARSEHRRGDRALRGRADGASRFRSAQARACSRSKAAAPPRCATGSRRSGARAGRRHRRRRARRRARLDDRARRQRLPSRRVRQRGPLRRLPRDDHERDADGTARARSGERRRRSARSAVGPARAYVGAVNVVGGSAAAADLHVTGSRLHAQRSGVGRALRVEPIARRSLARRGARRRRCDRGARGRACGRLPAVAEPVLVRVGRRSARRVRRARHGAQRGTGRRRHAAVDLRGVVAGARSTRVRTTWGLRRSAGTRCALTKPGHPRACSKRSTRCGARTVRHVAAVPAGRLAIIDSGFDPIRADDFASLSGLAS